MSERERNLGFEEEEEEEKGGAPTVVQVRD